MSVPSVDIVDDDADTRLLLGAWLEAAGYRVRGFADGARFLREVVDDAPAVVCLDVRMPALDGVEVLRRLMDAGVAAPVVMLTADDAVRTAVECMRLGAFDYQVKPVRRDHFLAVIEAARRGHRPSTPTAARRSATDRLLGDSEPMHRLREEIERVAAANISVFVHGESGTGKELVAQGIHAASDRAEGPFVALNCGAIAESLQEAELFGHEKGAFTGAAGTRKGRFEQAHGGTLLLDEIAELSSAAQVRLLRVLQERQVERLGGDKPIHVDVRVISATHRDLSEMVEAGTFRRDLYYRLVIYPIEVPPLRARREDIPSLFSHFVRLHAQEVGTAVPTVEAEVWLRLREHEWPGNVRELSNLAHRCVVMLRGEALTVERLPAELRGRRPLAGRAAAGVTMEDAERRALEEALAATGGNVTAAAKRLGIGRATFYRKLARHGIERPE